MRKTLFCAAIATLLFASCSKNEIVESTIESSSDFIATLDYQSRTELDGNSVVWNADDELTIFTKTEHNRHYKVKEISNNGRTATFGYVGFTGTSNGTIGSNYAVYPYDAEATISGDVISTSIAAEQKYNADKIDLSYALMAAKSQTTSFAFVNAGALMRFNISKSELIPDSYTLSSIKISSAANNIAGNVTIDLNTDSRAVVASTGSKEITLTAINQEITTEVQDFYIALPAMSFADNDLTVTFTFADGVKSFALPAFDLLQGSIKTIAYSINDTEDFVGTTPGEDNEEGTESTPVFNPNHCIYYKKNKTGGWDSGMNNYVAVESSFNGASGAVVEMKFKMQELSSSHRAYLGASSNLANDNSDEFYITPDSIEFYVRFAESSDYHFSYKWTDIGVNYTDLITLRLSSVDKTITINDKVFENNQVGYLGWSYLFSSYYRERDEGLWDELEGIPDMSELYYVKMYDVNGNLTYFGHAAKAINPATGNIEYCWYSNKNGVTSYEFAHNAIEKGGFGGNF